MKKIINIICLGCLLLACESYQDKFYLPVLGRSEIVEHFENGVMVQDTIPHTVANFSFIDQDSSVITNETFGNKIYVADFFFTSCTTICPQMHKQLYRVYEAYREDPSVGILSHTIDPSNDTVAVLAHYADLLDVKSDQWHFVTGRKNDLYEISETSYMVVANEDSNAPGGYIHSGAFLLVDKERRIRGVYDGTIPSQVDLLIKDIERLLITYENK